MGRSDPFREAVWRATLTPAEKLVALAIAEHANGEGECWPGRSLLARLTGLSERTVTRAIDQLGAKGVLAIPQGRGRREKHATFRFQHIGTQCPIPNESQRPVSGAEKGTSTTVRDKKKGQSRHSLLIKEPFKKNEPLRVASATATYLPTDFKVTAEMTTWAIENCPDVCVELETEKFCEYWASTTKNPKKRNWVMAWRTWLRRAHEWRQDHAADKRNSGGRYPSKRTDSDVLAQSADFYENYPS